MERYRYDVYGNRTVWSWDGSAWVQNSVGPNLLFDQQYGYTGRRHDPESLLMYYRLRYFYPLQGRFLTQDPIGNWGDPGNWGNGYAYVGNRGTVEVDALGLSPTGNSGDESTGAIVLWGGNGYPGIGHNTPYKTLVGTVRGKDGVWTLGPFDTSGRSLRKSSLLPKKLKRIVIFTHGTCAGTPTYTPIDCKTQKEARDKEKELTVADVLRLIAAAKKSGMATDNTVWGLLYCFSGRGRFASDVARRARVDVVVTNGFVKSKPLFGPVKIPFKGGVDELGQKWRVIKGRRDDIDRGAGAIPGLTSPRALTGIYLL
ncbi:MAG: hypothetical protein CSA62_00885 [Planctomycetota bacterium]|nr:MAG: hypothetical protein CSA62_00885 [Planctomycetota bacterium]